jgi:BirA family biotin operon repressor/biotin-[acetyl-CoA-carboxylase] ligase
LGDTITARTPRESVTGIFAGVDSDGQLVVETAHGRRRIAAADIFF